MGVFLSSDIKIIKLSHELKDLSIEVILYE